MQLSGCLLLSTLHPPIHPVAISMQFGSRESRLEKRTKRFDGMIERLTLDSATLTCVDNVRLRAVLRGVGEAGRVPDVRSSFQILYEDMAPIRMAADLIFPRLESTCDEAASQSQELPKSTSLAVSMDELDAARRLFDAIDADGGGSISKEELEESGLLSIINDGERETGDLTIDGFMEEADTDGDGDVSFVEFATYAASCEQLEGTDLIDVLAAVCKATVPPEAGGGTKKESPSEKFDKMLATVDIWYGQLGVDVDLLEEARLGRVLLGCFAGAKVPEVVEALRICYTDFKPLRVAGDLIFKVIGEVVERRAKARTSDPVIPDAEAA